MNYRPYQSVLIRFDDGTGCLGGGSSSRPGVIVIARKFPSPAKLPACQNWNWAFDGDGAYIVWSKIKLPEFPDMGNIWFQKDGIYKEYFDLTKLPVKYLDEKIGGFRNVRRTDIMGLYKPKCNFCK